MIKRKLKRLTREVFILSLTAGSTGIVLITLSGETREYGIWITVASFVCHMVGVWIDWKEEQAVSTLRFVHWLCLIDVAKPLIIACSSYFVSPTVPAQCHLPSEQFYSWYITRTFHNQVSHTCGFLAVQSWVSLSEHISSCFV